VKRHVDNKDEEEKTLMTIMWADGAPKTIQNEDNFLEA